MMQSERGHVKPVISIRHQAALDYARAGIRIFPCRVNGKKPAACVKSWDSEATTDEAQINLWWGEADYNPATSPDWRGYGVVDLDGAEGLKSWQQMPEDVRTRTTLTPSGGKHLWFKGQLRNSVEELAPKIDTRGIGGYVLLPPSYAIEKEKGYEGEYRWENSAQVAELSTWISDGLQKPPREVGAAKGEPVERSHLEALLRCVGNAQTTRDEWRDIVAAIRNTNLGDDQGDGETLEIALAWSRGDLSSDGMPPGNYSGDEAVEECFESMPPRPDGVGYGTILHSARECGYSGPSAMRTETPAEAFALAPPPSPERNAEPASQYQILTGQAIKSLPEPLWLVPDLIPSQSIGMFYGDEGTYKSFISLVLAFGLAHQKEVFGFTSPRPLHVLYLSGEGQFAIARHRIPAIEVGWGTETGTHFHYMAEMPPIYDDQHAAAMREAMEKISLKPDLIIYDTTADAMSGLEENDVRDVRRFIDRLKDIRRRVGCSQLLLHHTNKDDKYRGSTAFKALDFRARFTAWDAVTAVAVKMEKMRDAERRAEPWTFRGTPIGKGLFFKATTAQEHRELTTAAETVTRGKVGRGLDDLGRGDLFEGRVLAEVLTPQDAGQSAEQRHKAVTETLSTLNRLAATKLQGFWEGTGNARRWSLPKIDQAETF